MKQLTELQHSFQDCLIHPDKSVSTAWVSAAGRAAPETQLAVYTHAYTVRLKEVLANDYPAVLMAIGEEQFNQLAQDYIQAYPSCYYSLRDFGAHLPGFVIGLIVQDTSYRDLPWLYELSLFEWTLGQAFDAADATPLTERDMAAVSPEAWPELRFAIHPSVRRLDLTWNIPEMWQTLTADEPSAVSAVCDTASPWLVWREQLVTRFRSMSRDEGLAFDTLRRGGSFNELCEALATLMDEDEVPLRAAGLLKGWLAQGLISELMMP